MIDDVTSALIAAIDRVNLSWVGEGPEQAAPAAGPESQVVGILMHGATGEAALHPQDAMTTGLVISIELIAVLEERDLRGVS